MSDQEQAPSSLSTPRAGGWRLPASGQRPNHLEIFLLLGILLLTAGLRLHHLGYKSLGLEELIYLQLAQPGVSLFDPNGLTSAAHPPLYLLLMRLMSDISHAEGLLRLPAMLAGVGAVAALWALGRSLLGPLAGLLAASMLAMSALHIEISQEVHSYALLGLLSTLLLWSLVRAARLEMARAERVSQELGGTEGNQEQTAHASGRSMQGLPARWIAPVRAWLAVWWPFIATATLALYTHYVAIVPVGLSLLVFPCLLLAAASGPLSGLWREPARRRAWLHLVAALAVAGLLFLPQLSSGLGRSASGLAAGAGAFEAGLTDTLVIFVSNRSPWNLDPLFVPTMLLLALIGLVWLFWRRRPVAVALTLWMASPLLLVWLAPAASLGSGPQQLIFVQPVFLLAAAVGVTTAARLTARLAQLLAPAKPNYAIWANALVLVAFLLAFVKGSTDPIQATFRRPKQDWKGLAAILQQVPTPNDAVVILPGAAPLRWYYQGLGQVVDKDLVAELQLLCRYSTAVYVASATDGTAVSPADASFLQENYIEVPLKDLTLYYRNCQPDIWYGAGAEALFPLSRQPGLHFLQAQRAQAEFERLAAQWNPSLVDARASSSSVTTPPAGPKTTPATSTAAADAVTEPDVVAATAPAASPEQTLEVQTLLAAVAEAAPDDALTHIRLGAWALQQGASPEDAGEHFQRAIDLDPTAWLAYGLWANGLGRTKQITQAVQILNQGSQTLPDNLALKAMRARLQDNTASSVSDELAVVLKAGRSATSERNWVDAIDAAQQAIVLAPDRYEPQLLLGDAYRGSGELPLALQAYQLATELAPHLSFLHGRQAEILARLSRVDEALDASLTALAIDQSRWENWHALGRAAMAGALAADFSPANPGALEAARLAEMALLRAQALAPAENQAPSRSLADLRAALPQLNAGVPLESTSEPAVDFTNMTGQQRAAALTQADQALQRDKPAEALSIYQQLVVADRQDRASRMGFANALAALGRVDEALAELEAISADWPDFPFALIRQGTLLEGQGNLAEAIAVLEAAVQIAPDNANTHFTLAYALRRAGQHDRAIAEFEAGLAIDPRREGARQALDALRTSAP